MRPLCSSLKANTSLRRLVLIGCVQGADEINELAQAIRADCHLLELDITGNTPAASQVASGRHKPLCFHLARSHLKKPRLLPCIHV